MGATTSTVINSVNNNQNRLRTKFSSSLKSLHAQSAREEAQYLVQQQRGRLALGQGQ
jgi:hypothetical protein